MGSDISAIFSKGSSSKIGQEDYISFSSLMQMYIAYSFLLFVAYTHEYVGCRLTRISKKSFFSPPPEGYAPLLKDFEYFFTRYFYGPIRDCWDRMIYSGANAWIDVADRYGSDHRHTEFIYTGKSIRCLNLGSYNYLGFGELDSTMLQGVCAAIERFGASTGSTRLDAGTTALHRELERRVARFLYKEDAIVFGMGYQTNSTVLPTFVGKGGLIISDSLNHASLVVGCRTSGAKITIFQHNNPTSLEQTLRKAIAEGQPRTHAPWTKILIVVEGIYSMEGEIVRLKEIVELKKKYKAYLYVDEAHSIGAIGPTGRGVCDYCGVDTRDVDILMGTFTKSFASIGGYITGPKEFVSFLRNSAYGSVYDVSMSVPAAQQIIAALKVLSGDNNDDSKEGCRRIQALRDNAVYFRAQLTQRGFLLLGQYDSPVVPLFLGNPNRVGAFSRECLRRHLAVVVVGFPATPLTGARARFCLSAAHTREELDMAIEVLTEVADLVISRSHLPRFQRKHPDQWALMQTELLRLERCKPVLSNGHHHHHHTSPE